MEWLRSKQLLLLQHKQLQHKKGLDQISGKHAALLQDVVFNIIPAMVSTERRAVAWALAVPDLSGEEM